MLLENVLHYMLWTVAWMILLADDHPSGVATAFSTNIQLPISSIGSSTTHLFADVDNDNLVDNAFLEVQEVRALRLFSQLQDEQDGTISATELETLLNTLDIEATLDEAKALLKYLDDDADGRIAWDEFLPWYGASAETAQQVARDMQSIMTGRRTVDEFDTDTPVSDDVLERAVQCAIAAPNRSTSEPWRFVKVGPETVAKIAELKTTMETEDGASSSLHWVQIPGWCVVTTKLSPDKPDIELDDFKSTSCAVQNFMLSMWSEGIGTKWTSGPVQKTQAFADLCGVDPQKERVVGCIWYGFAARGLSAADPKRRKKGVADVLTSLP